MSTTQPQTVSGPRTLQVQPGAPRARMRECRLAVDGIKTRAIEVAGEGPAVLLLHGFCDSADTWRSVLDRLRQRGRAAFAVDLPGFGYAKPSRHPGNLLERQVAFTAVAVRELAARSGGEVIVAGNSLGGWTALRLAQQSELPIAGVIPIAPAGIEMSPWFFRADRIPGVAAMINFPAPIPERSVRNVIERGLRLRAFGAKERIDEAFIRSFSLHNRDRRKLLLRIRDAKGVMGELERPFDPELIEVPSVVVWGERDLLCLPHGAEPLAAQLGAELVMVPRCGHLPQVETPDVIVEAIERLC